MQIINTERIPLFVFADEVESGAIEQAKNVANHPAARHYVSIMPDTHEGYGMPIGGVCALENAISPNMVGVDIGCGMLSLKTHFNIKDMPETELNNNLVKTMRQVRKSIPMGYSHRGQNDFKSAVEHLLCFENNIKDYGHIDPYLSPDNLILSAKEQIGTLGGGNHFIEIQRDAEGFLYIMVHSGSRNIGKKVCDIFNRIALNFCQNYYSPIPNNDLAFLPTNTECGTAYIHLMNTCQVFAEENRNIMGTLAYEALCSAFGKDSVVPFVFLKDKINVHHNYAAIEYFYGRNYWIHRKGAICAREGMIGVIPGSMGTSSYIVKGKGNNKSWNSCSHGAGRAMSRKKAKETFTVDQFKEKMGGVVFHCDEEHIDESPMAYKDITMVMQQQADLVEIITELQPLAAEKA